MKPFDYDECMKNHGGYAVTRGGQKVRLLCGDANLGDQPVVGLLITEDRFDHPMTFSKDGRYHHEKYLQSRLDLFTPSEKKVGWINIYPRRVCSFVYESKEEANREASSQRVDCVRVEWEV